MEARQRLQYGVLPWRVSATGKVEILLITSRDTGRWVVPRGNPMIGYDAHEAAAQEAWEEAGIIGDTDDLPCGTYSYDKRRKRGGIAPTDVSLFPMRVEQEKDDWPERHERTRTWFEQFAAADAVQEESLKTVIRRFRPPPLEAGGGDQPLLMARNSRIRGFSMLKFFKAIMPKEDRFFDLFERHAATLTAGAEAMEAMFAGTANIPDSCARISDLEHQADDVAREVLAAVRRSFITPFDRSAITALISAMDDAIDEMHKTAKTITLYDVKSFEPQMGQISGLATQAAGLLAEAMPLLRGYAKNAGRLDQITERVVHLEGEADDVHETGLKALFHKEGERQPMNFIIGREIYSHLERVLDRFEDVADEIQGIVIDHA